MEYLQGLDNLKFQAKTKTIFVGFFSQTFRKRLRESIYLNICNREFVESYVFWTILSRNEAPAAAMMTKNNVKALIYFYFHNIDMEKGACGRYINRHKL